MRLAAFLPLVVALFAVGCAESPPEMPAPQASVKPKSKDVRFVMQNPKAGKAPVLLTFHSATTWTMVDGDQKTSGTCVNAPDQIIFTIEDSPTGKPKPPYDKFGGILKGDTLTIGPSDPPTVFRRG